MPTTNLNRYRFKFRNRSLLESTLEVVWRQFGADEILQTASELEQKFDSLRGLRSHSG